MHIANMEYLLSFLLLAFAAFPGTVRCRPLPPFHLHCDHNPVGLSARQLQSLHARPLFATGNPRPRLSWSLAHTERDVGGQLAFRVLLARDVEFSRIVWDSGVVRSSAQHVRYGGPPLQRGRVYIWRVSWWDEKGARADSEEVGHFLTGVLDPKDWDDAKWLAIPDLNSPVIFLNSYKLINPIIEATLHISGLGFFRATINRVDLHEWSTPHIFLAPGWTNYEHRVPYMTFPITELVRSNNTINISVILGIGWRDTNVFKSHDSPPPHPDSNPRVLRVIIDIIYSDNSSGQFYTDGSWTGGGTLFTADSIYNGETYDEITQISASLTGPVIVEGPSGDPYLPTMPYIAETGSTQPKLITNHPTDATKQIVDFGTNSAGVCKLNTQPLSAGAKVTMKHAEVMQHPPYGPKDGSLFYGNLRSAQQLDTFYHKSSPFYKPTFTYHGFRYVEVTGYPRKLTSVDIEKIEVHTAVDMNSNFTSDTPQLKLIQDAVVRGQLSNLMSVPTDCDQRDERLGWMGDSGLSSDSMAINFKMDAFFMNFLQLIQDEQTSDNSIPDVVPFYRYGGRPADPSWGSAFPQIAWVLMKQYNNTEMVEDLFPSIYKYIMFELTQVNAHGIGHIPGRYGDWCPPPPMKKVTTTLPSAFSFLNNIKQVGEMASALADTANASYFKYLFDKQAEEFNKAFLSEDGKYLDDLQVSYVLPLYLDIVPPDIKDKVTKYFINKLTTSDNTHITAGIIGTKFLLPVLSQLERHDLAMEIVLQEDYPSWLYMFNNPFEEATTIWELWNSHNGSSGMDSRNHHMFSSVSGWIQTDMVGLNQAEGSLGYEELELRPARGLVPSEASVSLQYPRPLRLSWKRRGGIRCGKSHEDRSPLNPSIPHNGGLTLSCGEGVIREVLFASFGNPRGPCGYHRKGACHAEQSWSVVEKLCVNKTDCRVPTGADFWGDVCSGETRWLTVAVQCGPHDFQQLEHYVYSSLQVEVSVPVGSHANLHLPAYGKSAVRVWEGVEQVFSGEELVGKVPGVLSAHWESSRDTLQLRLGSGEYSFVMKGERPSERRCAESTVNETKTKLRCVGRDHVISHIIWASYGNPTSCSEPLRSLGSCHSGVSVVAVEMECLGRQECEVQAVDEFFGGEPCPGLQRSTSPNLRWRLVVEYACNKRQ